MWIESWTTQGWAGTKDDTWAFSIGPATKIGRRKKFMARFQLLVMWN